MRAKPQKTEAQLREEVAILRQQVADLIHDIKYPLGIILGYTGVLLQQAGEAAPAQWVHAVERINGSALHMNALLTRRLDL
jgi:signal transduction histidine kinase